MTIPTKLCRSDKWSCQNGDKNYKKKYNKHRKRMWKKNISSYCRKLTTVSCDSFCVNGDYRGLYKYGSNRYNYHRNGKSFIWSFIPRNSFFVLLWLSCCFLRPSSCDNMRGKKNKYVVQNREITHNL